MTKTVDAVLRGPDPHFRDGVLYMPGQTVPEVPVEEVSEHDFRVETVRIKGADGELRDQKIQREVKFRPIGSK